MPRKTLFALMHFLAWGVAAFALVAYGLLPFGAALHPDLLPAFLQRQGLVYTHVFAAAVALLLGPLQFWPGLRARRPRLHRWAGRVYLAVGVGVGGVSGLLLAQHAYGGLWARAGFGLMAVAWVLTGAISLAHILRGDVAAHQRWMHFNFALTLAAVTLRLYLPAMMVSGVPLGWAYPVVAWLCWVPNLLLCGWYQRHATQRRWHPALLSKGHT